MEWQHRQNCAQLLIQLLIKLCEFEEELETSTRAVVDFQDDRSVVQSPKNLNRRDRIQIVSKSCEEVN